MNTVTSLPPAPLAHASDQHIAGAAVSSERGLHHRQASRHEPMVAMHSHSPFVPLLLGGLAMLGWLGFQVQQQLAERELLVAAHASQQQTVDKAGKLRASLDALAADTQRMAQAGNPSAKLLVDELARRGVTINATGAKSTTDAG
jgi:hypothetical protein